MTSKLLLPHSWKRWGAVLTAIGLPAGLYLMIAERFDAWPVRLTPFWEKVLWTDPFTLGQVSQQPQTLYLFDEAVVVCLLTGLTLLSFSREKIEDEWIAKIRLESLQWAVLVNTVLLVLFTVFVYDSPYFTVMIVNMFTPLLIFAARFHYILYLKPRLARQPA